MKSLELLIPPVVLFAIIAAVMWGIAQITPMLNITWLIRFGLALPIFAIALLIVLMSLIAFRKAKTTVTPLHPESASSLIQKGIFAYSRNPIYLALLLCLLGFVFLLASPFAMLGLVLVYVYITQFQIKPEERALQHCFGLEYHEYMKRVRRWL